MITTTNLSAGSGEAQGDDWPSRFITKNDGRPLLTTVLAPHLASNLFKLAEVGLQLTLLRDIEGMRKLRAELADPSSEGSFGHSLLVLSVAALEFRRSGRVAVEIAMQEGGWTPDVALASGPGPFFTECFRMVVGVSARTRLETAPEGGSADPIDEWSRVGARLVDKAGQASQQAGWLLCELDSGIFHDITWYRDSLGTGSLSEKLDWVIARVRESLEHSGRIAGVVVSSPPMGEGVGLPDQDCRLEDGCKALARTLVGGRSRQTFVVPMSASGKMEAEIWNDLYSDEPKWLNWALGEVGRPIL